MTALRFILVLAALCMPSLAFAQEVVSSGPALDPMSEGITQMTDEVRDMPVATTVRLIMILTALTFVPAILLVMTPFTRFIIVFSLLRQALGLQQAPPNQVLIGLALFMAALVMGPTLSDPPIYVYRPINEMWLDQLWQRLKNGEVKHRSVNTNVVRSALITRCQNRPNHILLM